MKKWNKSIAFTFDKLFWYILYALPLFVYMFKGSGDFLTSLNGLGITLLSDNLIISCLRNLFGFGGVLPLFNSDTLLVLVSWFVCVFLVHLAVDFLLFIPRLTHKWLGDCVNDEE